jgi:hypothetical protein
MFWKNKPLVISWMLFMVFQICLTIGFGRLNVYHARNEVAIIRNELRGNGLPEPQVSSYISAMGDLSIFYNMNSFIPLVVLGTGLLIPWALGPAKKQGWQHRRPK